MTTQKLLDQSGLTEGVVNLRLHEYVPVSKIQTGDIIRLDLGTSFDHWIKVGSTNLVGRGEEVICEIIPAHSENTMFTLELSRVVTRLTTQLLIPLNIDKVNPAFEEHMGQVFTWDERLTAEECQQVLDHFCQQITAADLIPSIEALFASGQMVSRIEID